ncbi:hypothetical protein G6F70_008635 [Rhizopus microsporus]|uniref:DUF788-domain-containing protein n=2 Tax=Rhizopus TaxID=4842 RepID=A0A367JL43_RHIAZ|nr:hypothetical protein G6F71_009124 [Rhizopus microsporus]RCH90657.1 hypothetical protein CU097_010805 [Rhizopus azygosporus]KAG1194913.1 hypothetical protein G6F70_008635 [Rhizopus microsporus]KAG1206763.1 hypothetical protein G6F69_008583 [Rhizopus microsporus]KAG1227262.1 hypothetical protein G6F67_008551 [Rhizopus microsporus]
MANASSKKIAISNKQTLTNLRKGFIIVNAIYFLWRVIYHWSSFTFSQFLLYTLTTGLTVIFYRILVASGTPTYRNDGTLVSSGDDLSAEGLTAYMFDIIYVTWFVHMTTAFISNKFWFTYLVIPAYAAYKVIPLAKSYFGNRPTNESEPAAETKSKRQAKLEKRANKGHVKYGRA